MLKSSALLGIFRQDVQAHVDYAPGCVSGDGNIVARGIPRGSQRQVDLLTAAQDAVLPAGAGQRPIQGVVAEAAL